MQVRLPEDKVEEIHSLAANLQERRVVSARSLMTFLGKVTFASYGVELARLHSRELQTALRTVYKRPRDICRTIHLHREALHSLDFWKELTPSPLPLRRPQAEIIMAINRRFVIGMGRQSSRIIGQRPLVHGSEVTPHELPGTDGRRKFASVISGQGGREDCVRPDRQQNSVAYLVKERGTKSVLLSRLACRILLWCQRHRVTLIPVYVRGIGNTTADALSRGEGDTMAPVTNDGGQDLSAVRDPQTAQLPQYMTLQRGDNQALAADALSQTDFDLVYAFPPPTLVPTVANKLRGSKTSMLLIARNSCRHASPDPHVSEAPDQHGDQPPGGHATWKL